jgi:peptide-methionine (S)-S-oxide reductase
MTIRKIGLGGGCHWCTEGVFSSLIGVTQVNQGWIASNGENCDFSEAIEVHFEPAVTSLTDLIEIHLHTHASTSNHAMRGKYRSAIYAYDDVQFNQASDSLTMLKAGFDKSVITQVYPFKQFKPNKSELLNYFTPRPIDRFARPTFNQK